MYRRRWCKLDGDGLAIFKFGPSGDELDGTVLVSVVPPGALGACTTLAGADIQMTLRADPFFARCASKLVAGKGSARRMDSVVRDLEAMAGLPSRVLQFRLASAREQSEWTRALRIAAVAAAVAGQERYQKKNSFKF